MRSYKVSCLACGFPTTQRLCPDKHGVLAYCDSCRDHTPQEFQEENIPRSHTSEDKTSGAASFMGASSPIRREAPEATDAAPQRVPCGTIHPDIAAVLSGEKRWCVIEGHCLDVLPTIPRVDHVITDPPYEAEAHTKNRRIKATGVDVPGTTWKKRGGQTVQKALNFEPISPEVRSLAGWEMGRVCAGWALVFCQFEGALLWRKAMEPPLVWKRPCIWVKPDAMPCLIGDRPGMGYEVFVALHAKGRSKWNGGGRVGVFTHMKDIGAGAGIRNEHPTTKPQTLMSELVSLFTFPGNVVLDPFCGSGSTGVACLNQGRRFIGIEKDTAYAALARQRLAAVESGSDLSAARAGQIPMFGRTG